MAVGLPARRGVERGMYGNQVFTPGHTREQRLPLECW